MVIQPSQILSVLLACHRSMAHIVRSSASQYESASRAVTSIRLSADKSIQSHSTRFSLYLLWPSAYVMQYNLYRTDADFVSADCVRSETIVGKNLRKH